MDLSWVNTSAPVGNSFVVTFVALDEHLAVSSINRTLTIESACPSGQSYCGGRCYPVTCDVVELLGLGSGGAAALNLVGEPLLRVPYGLDMANPASVLPCESPDDADAAACGAFGLDFGGTRFWNDVTVRQTTPCESPGGAGCAFCDAEDVGTAAGQCLPGTYTYTYAMTDSTGERLTATRSVALRERGRLAVIVDLFQPGGEPQQAARLAYELRSAASPVNAAFRAAFVASTRSAAPALRVYLNDVTIDDVTPEASAGGGTSIHLELTVDLNLVRGDRDATRRRLLQGDTIDMLADVLAEPAWGDALRGLLEQGESFAGIGSVEAVADVDTFARLTPPVDYAAGAVVSLASNVRMMLEGLADTEDALGRLSAELTGGLLREAGLAEEAELAQVQTLSRAYGGFLEHALADLQEQLVRPPPPPLYHHYKCCVHWCCYCNTNSSSRQLMLCSTQGGQSTRC